MSTFPAQAVIRLVLKHPRTCLGAHPAPRICHLSVAQCHASAKQRAAARTSTQHKITPDKLSLVSLLGALMSLCYCGIATVVSGLHKPTPEVSYQAGLGETPVDFTFGVFNAITTMLFAYGGHNIALEIQATLPAPPSTVRRMMRGVNAAFVITGICYFCVSITGFHAFGIAVPDNVLAGFGAEYKWPVAMANIFVVIHVAAAYQVYTQPVFDMVELAVSKKLKRPVGPFIRVLWRTFYVVLLTVIAILIPFFGSLMGLVGAIGITPTTFLLPCLLWVLYKKPKAFSRSWCVNWFLVVITGLIGILGTIGSVYDIAKASKSYSIFAKE